MVSQLRNSSKYAALFKEVQLQDARRYAKSLTNFSLAMQRFDSLTEPASRIFLLLPEVLQFLSHLTKVGDADDARWSRSLLSVVTGPGSYIRILKAALGTDALLIVQRFLRKDDAGNTEVFMKADEAGPLK